MTTAINYAAKHAKALYKGTRWSVLTMLILHANPRNRCWLGERKIADLIGASRNTVSKAIEWLLEVGALEIVSPELRIGKERQAQKGQHVYQLTGSLTLDNKIYPYLYTGTGDDSGSNFDPPDDSSGSNFEPPSGSNFEPKNSTGTSISTSTSTGTILDSAEQVPQAASKAKKPKHPRHRLGDVIGKYGKGLVKGSPKSGMLANELVLQEWGDDYKPTPAELDKLADDTEQAYIWRKTQPDAAKLSPPYRVDTIWEMIQHYREFRAKHTPRPQTVKQANPQCKICGGSGQVEWISENAFAKPHLRKPDEEIKPAYYVSFGDCKCVVEVVA